MAVGVMGVDPLTGALTRASLEEKLLREIEAARENGGSLSLLMLDLDYFKSVNDAFGHIRGDAVLVEFARRLHASTRVSDLLFRYGGDEFLALLPGACKADAAHLAERLLDNLRSSPFEGEPPLFLSASIGVATYPDEEPDSLALIELADRRAYYAKRNGRGRIAAGDAVPTGLTAPLDFGSVSRLIERDEELQSFTGFLGALDDHKRGAFSIQCQPGSGSSRFLEEAVTLGRLQGYLVLPLHGEPASQATSFGALHRAGYKWLPVGLQDSAQAATLIGEQVTATGAAGVMFALDEVGAIDTQTLAVVRRLIQSPSAYPVCVVSTGAVQVEDLLGMQVPLAGTVHLKPLSPSAVGVWVRSLLRWEPPSGFVTWLHTETGGLPARVSSALLHLLEKGALVREGGNWSLRDNYAAVQLRHDLGWERKPASHNLPSLPYSFIGRGREIAQLRDLISLNRLVTVTGPGGVGKTHLALHAASEMLADFEDGVYLVPLATILDPELVAPTIAQALGLKLPGDQAPVAALAGYLAEKRTLLLLDNFEQVASASPGVGELLNACPSLSVLATSREPLHLRAEHVFPLSPLAVPESGEAHPVKVESYPAVALFVQRARAANPAFELTADNAETVAAICSHLDGLPLAIELVAARTRLMPVKSILARLGTNLDPSALRLLTGGSRDLPARHRTLRDAIAWSYDLLDAEEQRLFACLGTFAGGFTFSMLEEIFEAADVASFDTPLLDLLASLLDKSLLRTTHDTSTGDEPRFTMLEMLREFACERLDDMGEADRTHRLHALYFMRLADVTEARLTGPEQKPMLARLAQEHDNLRAALDWSVKARETEIAVRTAGGLWRFWWLQGHIAEGRAWLRKALELVGDLPRVELPHDLLSPCLRALRGAGVLARSQCDYAQANRLLEEALILAQRLGDTLTSATVLNSLGLVALDQGLYEEAEPYFMQSMALERALGDKQRLAISLNNLGGVSHYQGHYARATEFYLESLSLRRELGDNWGIANSLYNLGESSYFQGKYEEAASQHRESLTLRRELGDTRGMAPCLEGLAGSLAALGRPEVATRLFGAAESLREANASPVSQADCAHYEQMVDAAKSALSEGDFTTSWAMGRKMSLEQAMSLAVDAG